MIFETADAHCSDDCLPDCPHPDHQLECVVDLTSLLGFDRYEPAPERDESAGVLWL